jgi:tetratricopeptide (TPR) repeat protein
MPIDSGPEELGTAVANIGLIIVLALVSLIPIGLIVKAWLVDAVLEVHYAAAGIALILALSGLAWATQNSGLAVVFIGILLIGCIVFPFVAAQQSRSHLKEIRDDDMDKYRRAIERDPNNASAYVFLGDALMERKAFVAAQAQYEMALMMMPNNDAWKRKLRNAQEALASVKT